MAIFCEWAKGGYQWRETGCVTGGAVPICTPGAVVEPQPGDVIYKGLCANGWREALAARGLTYEVTHSAMDDRWSLIRVREEGVTGCSGGGS